MNKTLAALLATLPLVAAFALPAPRGRSGQGVGERVPLPAHVPPVQPADASASIRGELAVRLVDVSGKTLRSAEFELHRLDDGWSTQWPITPGFDSECFVLPELQPGRYRIEAMDEWPSHSANFFALGYADVTPGTRTSLTLGHVAQQPCTVAGRVLLRGSGMSDAEVRASLQVWPQPLGVSTEVDAEGRFTLTMPRAGDWELHVESPGWPLGARAWGEVGSQQFHVAVPATGLEDLTLDVSDARVSGVIRGLDGLPAPGLIVCVRSDQGEHGKWCRAYTDSDGRYEFRELPLGEWVIYVDPRHARENSQPPPPGAITWRVVTLTAQNQRAEHIDLQLQPVGALEWQLTAFDGRLIEWAGVSARPVAAPEFFWFDAGDAGTEGWATDRGRTVRSRGLPPGAHELSIQLPRDRLASAHGSQLTVESIGWSTGAVALVSTSVLRVRAVDARGTPAIVRIVDLVPAGGRGLHLRAPATFYSPLIRIEAVPAGEYVVRIADPAGRTYEQTITLDGELERDVLFQL